MSSDTSVKTFKYGDRVYCPSVGRQVYILKKSDISLPFYIEGFDYTINENGFTKVDKAKAIYHLEDRELLEQLYGEQFDIRIDYCELCNTILSNEQYMACVDVRTNHKLIYSQLDKNRQSNVHLRPFDLSTGRYIVGVELLDGFRYVLGDEIS